MGRGALAVASTAMLLALAVVLAVLLGSEPVSLVRALTMPDSIDHAIVFEARLPRVLLGAVAGGGLAMVGVAFQAILRNPLAEPFVLGASFVPLAALVGGLGATALVYAISKAGAERTATSILLAGVVVNYVASAAITFLKMIVSASKAQEVLFWLVGFLDVPGTAALVFVTLYAAAGGAVLLVGAGRLNLLALGDEQARHLGVDVKALERRTFLACSF